MPFADTATMNAHLAEIARTVAPRAHAALVFDGAGWHGGHELVARDNLSLLLLPPYSPELNPVENVWQYLRANWLTISVFDDYDAIAEACCRAWNCFADDPDPSPPSPQGNGQRSTPRTVGIGTMMKFCARAPHRPALRFEQ